MAIQPTVPPAGEFFPRSGKQEAPPDPRERRLAGDLLIPLAGCVPSPRPPQLSSGQSRAAVAGPAARERVHAYLRLSPAKGKAIVVHARPARHLFRRVEFQCVVL